MRPFDELISLISEFPGIGPRQARRIAQFLLTRNRSFIEKLGNLMRDVKNSTVQCVSCFRYTDSAAGGVCKLCADNERDSKLLMVVEKDIDIEGIESAAAYRGKYFVLGGLMPMTAKKNAPLLRTKELEARIEKDGVNEIILAFSTTPEGDYTSHELARHLRHTPEQTTTEARPRITLLGRGLSVGAEIEYADGETLRQAIRGRQHG